MEKTANLFSLVMALKTDSIIFSRKMCAFVHFMCRHTIKLYINLEGPFEMP